MNTLSIVRHVILLRFTAYGCRCRLAILNTDMSKKPEAMHHGQSSPLHDRISSCLRHVMQKRKESGASAPGCIHPGPCSAWVHAGLSCLSARQRQALPPMLTRGLHSTTQGQIEPSLRCLKEG